MIGDDRIKICVRQNDYLYGKAGNWRSYWQDVASFCLPRKAWVTSIHITGDQLKYNFLYNVRAIRNAKKMTAGFYSNLTNPSSKWFGYATREKRYMESNATQMYFKECEDIVYGVKNASNWDQTVQEYYLDSGVFGTGNIWSFDDSSTDIMYMTSPIEQILLEEDPYGNVIAVYRNFQYTAAQCWEMWGENCSKAIKDAVKDEKWYQMFDIIHYVGPRDRRDVSKKDIFNMDYESLWIVKKEQHLLDESGTHELPVAVMRFWKDNNDCFGYSPFMDILASIKLANAQKRTIIRAGMKQADPALMLPNKGWIAPLNLNPAALNYYDPKHTNQDSLKAIENKGNLPITVELMEMENKEIDEGSFVTLFDSLSNITKQMTVPEVQRRVAENLQLLGPVIGRHTRTLGQVLKRDYMILHRKGKLPPVPKELVGKDLDVIYLSPLAKAQRSSEMSGLSAWISLVADLTKAVNPEAKDKINIDHVIDMAGEILGVDPSAINDQKKVDGIREKNRQLQLKMMQMQALESAGKTSKSVAEARKAHAEAAAV